MRLRAALVLGLGAFGVVLAFLSESLIFLLFLPADACGDTNGGESCFVVCGVAACSFAGDPTDVSIDSPWDAPSYSSISVSPSDSCSCSACSPSFGPYSVKTRRESDGEAGEARVGEAGENVGENVGAGEPMVVLLEADRAGEDGAGEPGKS